MFPYFSINHCVQIASTVSRDQGLRELERNTRHYQKGMFENHGGAKSEVTSKTGDPGAERASLNPQLCAVSGGPDVGSCRTSVGREYISVDVTTSKQCLAFGKQKANGNGKKAVSGKWKQF